MGIADELGRVLRWPLAMQMGETSGRMGRRDRDDDGETKKQTGTGGSASSAGERWTRDCRADVTAAGNYFLGHYVEALHVIVSPYYCLLGLCTVRLQSPDLTSPPQPCSSSLPPPSPSSSHGREGRLSPPSPGCKRCVYSRIACRPWQTVVSHRE